jgi:hypothetical protein
MPAGRHYAEPMSSAAVANIAIGILLLRAERQEAAGRLATEDS